RHLLLGELGAAVARFGEVVELCNGGGFSRAALSARLNLAQVLISLGQTAAARESLSEAGALAESAADAGAAARVAWLYRLTRARLHALAGVVAYAGGEYPQAERIFGGARAELTRLGLRPDLLQAVRFLGWCAVRLGRPEAARGELHRRVQELTQELADTLP